MMMCSESSNLVQQSQSSPVSSSSSPVSSLLSMTTDNDGSRRTRLDHSNMTLEESQRMPPPPPLPPVPTTGGQPFDRQASSVTWIHSNCTTTTTNNKNKKNSKTPTIPPPTNTTNNSESTNRIQRHSDLATSPSNQRFHDREDCVDNNKAQCQDQNHLDTIQYYRIVYKGVVALLQYPDPSAPRTGSYLGYGEVFGCWSQKSSSPCTTTRSNSSPATTNNIALHVDIVLSGGYAVDATTAFASSSHTVDFVGPTPKRSNITNTVSTTNDDISTDRMHATDFVIAGYILCQQHGKAIVEPLTSIPQAESGPFHYKITSSSPLPILTGPAIDAPRTKAVVLPGTVEEISLRLCLDSLHHDEEIWYLRLNHRRGWITDRMMVKQCTHKSDTYSNQQFFQAMPVVQEVQLPSLSDNQSLDGSSVWSGGTGTTSILSNFQKQQKRHKPPRRRRDASIAKDNVAPPRHITERLVANKLLNDSTTDRLPPSSNVSVMSDDSSSLDQKFGGKQPTSPDTSFATNRSTGSTHQPSSTTTTTTKFFLIRVTAPQGLKILDTPHFQVNNLIRKQNAVSSSHLVSQVESIHNNKTNHHSIFQTMSGRLLSTGPSQLGNSAIFDTHSKTRRLPRSALFEASMRMESTGSYSQGAGLIKLSDNSGWAVVPRPSELEEQFRHFTGIVQQGEKLKAYEEVGSAVLESNPGHNSTNNSHTTNNDSCLESQRTATAQWRRVVSRPGVPVVCPPPQSTENDDATSPTSSRGSSCVMTGSNHDTSNQFHSNESDIASSVGSSFLDAVMFRSPYHKRREAAAAAAASAEAQQQQQEIARNNTSKTFVQSNLIPCGMMLEVEQCADPPTTDECVTRDYLRLCGGQGWIPTTILTTNVSQEMDTMKRQQTTIEAVRPEFRYGSFWYRVQPTRGLRVRLGPSRRAPSIKSEDGVHFRFECGEFLRASEVVTIFSKQKGSPIESFARLYRNRHTRFHLGNEEYRSLASLTVQAEWVQVYSDNELYLEECVTEPRIERHKQGWRYDVVPEDGVAVRKGPSFASEKTGIILFGGESVVVNERVIPAGDKISWLRMKDGQGWIYDVDDEGKEIMIAHSLRHRIRTARPYEQSMEPEGNEPAYNAVIARLFHNDNATFQTSMKVSETTSLTLNGGKPS